MRDNQILLVETQPTVDIAPTFTGASVIETTGGITIDVYAGNETTREVDSVSDGAKPTVNTNPHQIVSFKTELAGSGTAGTAPPETDLLLSCNFIETVSAAVSVTYQQRITGTAPMVGLRRHIGNEMSGTVINSRGSVGLEMGQGQLPTWNFSNFKGKYEKPAGAVWPAGITYPTKSEAVILSTDNTAEGLIDGYAACISAFSVDWGLPVTVRNLVNCSGISHGVPETVGSVTLEAPDPATKNYFTNMESHNGYLASAISIIHGTVAGNIVDISSTDVQFGKPVESVVDDILFLTIPLRFIESPVVVFT